MRTVADGAQAEKATVEAWHGAFGRTHARIGGHQDGCVHIMRMFMQPRLTFVALSWPRGASAVTLHTRAEQSTRSKPGLS